jgi:exonuclease SbcC
MRPIRMTLRAFGPFPGTEVVDFRPALGSRLFGIYGPTGAGKTSILDGICFSLFGESSGHERKGDDLRSHHAPPDVETEATLVFEVGAHRYHVVRRPRQSVQGRRGAALVERVHWAALYDATHLDIDNIGPANPGTVLEERKVEAVGERIRSILNYSAAQFRQVVLLPQGQFRKLLTASSDDRSAVLRGLFDVSVYERFVEHLKGEASGLRDGIRDGRTAIRARLDTHGLGDIGELEAAIAGLVAGAEEQTGRRDAAEQARDGARASLEEAKRVDVLFKELDSAKAAVDELQPASGTIDRSRIRLDLARRAQDCAAADALVASDASRLVEAKESHDEAVLEETNAQERHARASEGLRASNARQPERLAASTKLGQHEVYQQKVEQAGDQLGRLEQLRASADEAKRRFDAAAGELARAKDLLGLLRQLSALKREERTASGFRDAMASVHQLEQEEAGASGVRRKADRELKEARGVEAAAQSALLQAQASHLASELRDGTPCPVCGALEHPDPAAQEAGGHGIEEAVRDAAQRRARAEVAASAAGRELSRIEGKLEAAREHLRGLKPPMREISQVKSDIADLEDRLELAFPERSTDDPEAGAEAALIEVGHAETSLERFRRSFDTSDTKLKLAEERLKTTLADVPEVLRSKEAINDRIRGLATLKLKLEQDHNKATEEEKDAFNALAAASGTSRARAEEMERLVNSHHGHLRNFTSAKRKAGLSDDEYATAKADIPNIIGLDTEITEYYRKKNDADGRLDRARLAIEGKERPDVAAADEAWTLADNASKDAHEKLTRLGSELERLQSTGTALEEIQNGMADKEARYGVVGELEKLANGSNDHNLRLRDFAIAATFDQVLEAANERFARMSRNRFTLLRKAGGGDGRSKSGLDIEVHDAHTDQKRDAHTLSGGEGFLASLSLALGLSDVVQAEAGGVKLDAIFIDEGFGHLDDETLDVALDTLRDLVGQDRAVGVISHVDAVKEQIPRGFDVVRLPQGSVVRERVGN